MKPEIDQNVRPFFFIHLHKTAGISFRKMLWSHFPQEHIFPNAEDERVSYHGFKNLTPELYDLVHLAPERLSSIRLLCGHYPFIAGSLFSQPPRYLTFLRHPVERTISHLKHGKSVAPALHDKSLAEIFDLQHIRKLYLRDPQTKAFSYASIEEGLDIDNPVRVDRARLELAKENLLKCEFVGIQEEFNESIRLYERIFGWKFETIARENVTVEPSVADETLRARILAEVEFDMEFYEFACRINREMRARYLPESVA